MQTKAWSRSSLGWLFLQDIFITCGQKKALSQLAVGNEEEWRLRLVQTPVTREQYLSTHNGYIAKKKPPKFGGKRGG